MTLLHRSRLALRHVGIDVIRYPAASHEYRAFRAFTSSRPDVIIDVGANDGGYALQCREFGYTGPIVSFEPGAEAYSRLERACSVDPLWSANRLALGDAEGVLDLHVTANAGASSSLLRMLAAHESAAPSAIHTSDERVAVRRLDAWLSESPRMWDRIALKIDTQGYERQVLQGLGSLLGDRVVSVQVELSLVPLYEGSWLWGEAVAWLESEGFDLAGLTPGFSDPETGRLLQFDGVFLSRSQTAQVDGSDGVRVLPRGGPT